MLAWGGKSRLLNDVESPRLGGDGKCRGICPFGPVNLLLLLFTSRHHH